MPSAKVKPPSPAPAALVLLLLFAASFGVSHAGINCGDPAASPSPAPPPTSTAAANGSAFGANLQTLLNALPEAAAPTGFASLSLGSGGDRAFVRGLCRGDTAPSQCLAALIDAVQDFSGKCGSNRSAGAWYGRCTITYADTNDSTTYEGRIGEAWYDRRTVADADGYERSYYALMSRLVERAAGGGGGGNVSARTSMFATGQAVYAPSDPNGTLYGLVQCMRDRGGAECERCLQGLVPRLPSCCKGHQGGVVQNFNCILRVQIYTFYDLALDAPPPGPAAPPPVPSPSSSGGKRDAGKRRPSKRAAVLAAALSVGALLLLLFVLVCLYTTQRRRIKANRAPRDDGVEEGSRYVFPEQFTLPLLRAATGNFAAENKLGEGGFGQVFKGILPDGQAIAVKRLSQSSSQGFHELKNELLLAAKLLHRNLVQLLGVCLEEREKLVVYEYLPNRSLDAVLFHADDDDGHRRRRRRRRHGALDWRRRHTIICGIARGLLYLHEESQLRVIHRDLKPSNVLLDEDMNPKISDFGLARAFRGDQSRDVTKRAAGTLGYMSPEYAYSGHVSTKSDMYSFGVIVLEIVTGRKNASPCSQDASASNNLLSDVWDKWKAGKAAEIADASLDQNYPRSEMLNCVHIGLLCVQKKPAQRPDASEVVLMLSSQSTSRRTPSRPAFYSGHSTGGGVTSSRVSSGNVSENGVTMSELQPR